MTLEPTMQQANRPRSIATTLSVAAALLSAGCGALNHPAAPSAFVMKRADVAPVVAPFGELRKYVDGGATVLLRDVVTGLAELKPGQEVHPPHQHAEEEYLYVLSGHGTWHVDGKDSPAETGDLMYTPPWIWHGLTNTGSEPLTFCVFKWAAK